jgi:hypothetical protein
LQVSNAILPWPFLILHVFHLLRGRVYGHVVKPGGRALATSTTAITNLSRPHQKPQRRINDRHICASAAASTLYVIFTTRTAQVKRSAAREGGCASYDKWILLYQQSGSGNTQKQRRERSDEQEEKDW